MRYLFGIGLAVGTLVAGVFWYRWDSSRNRGYSYGYYGQFNTISNALTKLPGVTILKSWHNADVTLEEFGFEILSRGQQVALAFGENDSIRKRVDRDLEKALLKLIEIHSSGNLDAPRSTK